MIRPRVSTTAVRRVPTGPGASFLWRLRAAERDPLQFLLSLHQQYGDVVHARFFLLDLYLVVHPDHVKHVLQDRHTIYTKDTFDYRLLRSVAGEGLLTSDGSVWLRQRRLIQPAFHRQRIAAFASMMTERTVALLDRWQGIAERGDVLDITAEMTRLTLEIVTGALFGTDIGDEADTVGRAFLTVNQYVTDRFFSPFALITGLPTRGGRRAHAAMRTLRAVVNEIVTQRRQRNADTGDLLSMLLLARDEDTGDGMTDQQIQDEVMTLLIAGHETTTDTLSWVWYLLSSYPMVADKLRAELATMLGGRIPTVDDLPDLSYNRMVIEEAMRYYPPAWSTSRAPAEDDEIGGFHIPAKSVVVLSPYVTHRHPAFWDNPEGFDPERFTPERSAERPRFAYFPFGGGPRLCIGNTFAMTEVQLVLATVAQRFRLDLVPGHRVVPEPLITLRPRGGVLMMLHSLA